MDLGARARRTVRRSLWSITAVTTTAPLLALTFDDGPDPRLTPAVLEVLARRAVRATFFLVAERARRHPDLARRVVAEGHDVGLHGDRHVDHCGIPLTEQYRALRRGRRDVEAIVGRRVRWFRPPYGRQDPETVAAGRAAGMRCLLWSASAHDWEDEPITAQLAQAASGLRPGAVVLLHDGAARPVDPPAPLPPTQPELLERLLDELAVRALRPVTIGELCAAGRPVRSPWFETWLHH